MLQCVAVSALQSSRCLCFVYDSFHWNCYTSTIHQIEKLRFLGFSCFKFHSISHLNPANSMSRTESRGTSVGGKFSTNLSPFGRIRQVQSTTRCHNFGNINLPLMRINIVLEGTLQTRIFSTNPKGLGANSNLLWNARWNLEFFCTESQTSVWLRTDTATHCNTLQHTATHCNTL